MMRKIICLFILLVPFKSPKNIFGKTGTVISEKANLITRLFFASKSDNSILPAKNVLEKAITGYTKLERLGKLHLQNALTIIDFSLPSSEKRMWVFDVITGKILYHCYVAHGKNSGEQYAQSFSNKEGSHQSSLGFFVTGTTYTGKHGLSLYLDGQEKNINNLARKREIVIHGADYVSEDFIKQQGHLGRSFGCPALPTKLSTEIIRTIEGGSVLFIYAPDKNYISKSEFINAI